MEALTNQSESDYINTKENFRAKKITKLKRDITY